MIAEVYEVVACDNATNLAHGIFRDIIEVFIPSKKIAFNEDYDMFHCFTANRDRYKNETKIGEIEIPNAMTQAMVEYVNACKRLGKTKKWYKRCILTKHFKKNTDIQCRRKKVKK